jgi:hypothetical protein
VFLIEPMRLSLSCTLFAFFIAVGLPGCDRSVATEVRGHRIKQSALGTLQLNQTTEAEIESQFGEPGERAPDGAVTYRYSTIRRLHPRFAGVTLPISTGKEVTEHTVTFHFKDGVLSRICRTRSLPGAPAPSGSHVEG